MSELTAVKPYTLESYEKATPVMVYTANSLVRGEVITREAVRVSTWLRTQGAPEYVGVYGATVLLFPGAGSVQTLQFSEYHIPLSQVWALHITPPGKDPVDYDPNEQNRKMEPVTAMVGSFRFNGHLRMATQSTLVKVLEVNREAFNSMYDVEITNTLQSGGALKTPLAVVRGNAVIFAKRAA